MPDSNINIDVAVGENFSGRSDYLKNSCDPNNRGIYIGEIPGNYLSGISPTVSNELSLFSTNAEPFIEMAVQELLSNLEFDKLSQNNPFLLSGGEQVILSIATSILLNPSLLAIDTASEQLSMEWKIQLFDKIIHSLNDIHFLLSDNRIDEYNIKYNSKRPYPIDTDYKYTFSEPNLIKIENRFHSHKIKLDHVEFGYSKKQTVLENIDLDLDPGNIYFLTGVNGAGKSTLAKILAGILKPRHGMIYDNNQAFNSYKYPGKLFGYCFQNPDEQLFSSNIAAEILAFKKDDAKLISERRNQFIKMFGLENLSKAHPAEMPFVIRKRIALAATLAYDRPWYILDEPTIGQDATYVDFLISLFNYLTSIGKGIIIISHSKSFITRFQSKILNLDKGHLKTS